MPHQQQSKVLFTELPQVWRYNMASGVMEISAEFNLSHLFKGKQRGIWQQKTPQTETERQLETGRETDTKTAEGER